MKHDVVDWVIDGKFFHEVCMGDWRVPGVGFPGINPGTAGGGGLILAPNFSVSTVPGGRVLAQRKAPMNMYQ